MNTKIDNISVLDEKAQAGVYAAFTNAKSLVELHEHFNMQSCR